MITIATKNDIKAMSDLLSILFTQEAEFIPQPQKQKLGLQLILDHPEMGTLLIAKENNECIGMVSILYSVSTALGAKVAILEDMIISPEHRNQGIGQLLIEKAIQTAKHKHCQRITLLTDSNNTNAHRFYERNGFNKSDMIPFRLGLI